MGSNRSRSFIDWVRQLFSHPVGKEPGQGSSGEEDRGAQRGAGDEATSRPVEAGEGGQSKPGEAQRMAEEPFEKAVRVVLREEIEGGYVDDPEDPGGETNHGISKRAHPNEDIKNMTIERAKQIYREQYWDAAGCNDLPLPHALLVFDCAVNQGVQVAQRLWKKAKGRPEWFMAERALRYSSHRKFKRFGRGWMRRLFIVANESARI